MRFPHPLKTTIVLLLFAVTPPSPGLAEGAWSWSALEGEEKRSIVSCSPGGTDHAWLCLALRCDAPNEIALYADLTNMTLDNRFDLVFPSGTITVWGQNNDPALPYTNRIGGPIDDIIAAMRTNPTVTIDRPYEPINPRMSQIPLSGANEAIDALIRNCTPDPNAG